MFLRGKLFCDLAPVTASFLGLFWNKNTRNKRLLCSSGTPVLFPNTFFVVILTSHLDPRSHDLATLLLSNKDKAWTACFMS